MVQETARACVAGRLPISARRALADQTAPEHFDRALWRQIAKLGWPGAAISENYGGANLGARALTLIIEEIGKNLGTPPLISTALVAALTIERFADPDTAQRWLPAIARGDIIAALAVEQAKPAKLKTIAGKPVLSGAKNFIADAISADLFLVSVPNAGASALALVRADAPGAAIRPIRTIDGAAMAEITWRDTPIDALLIARENRDPVTYALDCARIGLAAEMLGASSRAFEMTLDYLRMRRQFGQFIGAFQALQHRAAKLFIEIELTKSCVFAAADALHHDTDNLALLASLAKASASELMRTTSYEMIQMHGGIGMTDAHQAGLYLKRGRVMQLLYGDAAFHVDRYARLKGY